MPALWNGVVRYARRDQGTGVAAVVATAEILERAVTVVSQHALRSLDAIQLAAALAARDADRDVRGFA